MFSKENLTPNLTQPINSPGFQQISLLDRLVTKTVLKLHASAEWEGTFRC